MCSINKLEKLALWNKLERTSVLFNLLKQDVEDHFDIAIKTTGTDGEVISIPYTRSKERNLEIQKHVKIAGRAIRTSLSLVKGPVSTYF